jgi:hypothetical protein
MPFPDLHLAAHYDRPITAPFLHRRRCRAKLNSKNCSCRNPAREQKWIPGQDLVRKLQPGHIGGQKGFNIMVRRLTQGVLRACSGCSGSAPAYSPSAQVKAVAVHVRRLKQNQRKRKLILSI